MIRNSQMDIFQKSAEERFVERTAEHIRKAETLDAEGLDDASLKDRVKIGISRARSQGLTWESSITGYVYLMFTVAPDFGERPAFRKLLDNLSVEDENKRMEALFERIGEEEWEEARLQGDRGAWNASVPEGQQ